MVEQPDEFGCPYLGLLDDPDTRFTFPSDRHSCQNANPVLRVDLEHQAAFCLNPNYPTCAVFSSSVPVKLPKGVAANKPRTNFLPVIPVLSGITILAIILALTVRQFGDAFALPTPTQGQATQVIPVFRATASISTPEPELATLQPEEVVNNLYGLYLPYLLRSDPNLNIPPEQTHQVHEPILLSTPSIVVSDAVPPMKTCQPPAGWVTYSVQKGDTLFQLGLAVRKSVNELVDANCLSNTMIRIGQILYLPHKIKVTPLPTKTPRPEATIEPLPTPTEAPSATPYPYP